MQPEHSSRKKEISNPNFNNFPWSDWLISHASLMPHITEKFYTIVKRVAKLKWSWCASYWVKWITNLNWWFMQVTKAFVDNGGREGEPLRIEGADTNGDEDRSNLRLPNCLKTWGWRQKGGKMVSTAAVDVHADCVLPGHFSAPLVVG